MLEKDRGLYDEFTRLNNELTNAQRELAKKNRELEERLRQVQELQEHLLEAERTRVLIETAGAAAHEINQPLTVIVGVAQLLLEPSVQPSERDFKSLLRAGQKINEIVRKMQSVEKYASKSYLEGVRIVDFEGGKPRPSVPESPGAGPVTEV